MASLISVIIPTLNAGNGIAHLLEALYSQSRVPDEVIVVDSSSDDDTAQRVREFPQVILMTVKRKDFNHGGTRDMAFRRAKGDLVLFLTQDAMPAGVNYISDIIAPFNDPAIGMASGRQLPKADARPAERLIRAFNYPAVSFTRSKADLSRLGIKTYFASDVCSAYRASAYLAVGGFESPVETNEDMFIAAKMVQSGYKIAYVAEAAVFHSHNFSLKQQYKRNFLIGKAMEEHKALLSGAEGSVGGEGARMVGFVIRGLLSEGRILSIPGFCLDCAARLLGNRLGSRAALQGES